MIAETGNIYYWTRKLCRVYGLIGLVVVCLVVTCVRQVYSDASQPSEHQVKAACLYNFAKFIEWPSGTFDNSDSPIVMGIVGDDPFGKVLDQTVKDKVAGGRKIVIKRFETASKIKPCQILFVSSSEKRRLDKVFEAIKGWSVLTVGEFDEFTRRVGIVNFTMKGQKVRFEINVDHAKKANLKISSKLLSLADIVNN